ncbi:PilZ domain-containing protein [Lysobacter solisilvae (ex Woo and Kim 2020)]|uniref:PilZ domain-containing protein n=1 Tax=Agrilutibacter terrestris TaxID=2865112 RepID=A0A7H0FUN4_9GAMM|nr:PilZ domain-containing protein [Lysobacter terrestris]QNP39750.1 PilZ domain-containing protein [Lysobacter terrestris]
MKEFRRSRRRQVAEIIQVTDSMTELVIGHVGNVSETGMLVMSNAPLVVDALYQLRFALPEGISKTAFEVGTHLLWRDQASAPGQAWTGFRFITMSEQQMQQLRRWIDAPGSQYA